MTPTQRANALRLANSIGTGYPSYEELADASDLLRALVAQADAQAEPVAWLWPGADDGLCLVPKGAAMGLFGAFPVYASPQAPDAADALRYRFWRKFYRSQFAINGHRSLRFMPSRPAVEVAGPDYEAVVDAAIDAAIAKETP